MKQYTYKRNIVKEIIKALNQNIKLIHIIVGPRQVGKTVVSQQISLKWSGAVVEASADSPVPLDSEWINFQWDKAIRLVKQNKKVLIIFDEIQKVKGWSEVLKLLWDRELKENLGISVLVLGSSSLLLQKGLSESLAGRFMLYKCNHWSFIEMRDAFGWDFDKWVYFGGYPGAVQFINNENVWKKYIMDSLIETVLNRDVLQLQTVNKPALLRNLFGLSALHPAEILSYNKMLGQLQEAGNTTTLAGYLKLLETAFLISGLELFKQGRRLKKGSSPKLIIWNNALINALNIGSFEDALKNKSLWGRLIENCVGAYLLNTLRDISHEIYYWHYRDYDVDFIVKSPGKTWAVEVKSGKPRNPKGLKEFIKRYPDSKPMIIGSGGIELEDFFTLDLKSLFS